MSFLAALCLATVTGGPDSVRKLERELPPASREYRVSSSFGACTIHALSATAAGKARVEVEFVVSGGDADAQHRLLERATLDVKNEAGATPGEITTSIGPLLAPEPGKPADAAKGQLSFAATLEVWLPAGALLVLDTSFGKVLVDGPLGGVNARQRLGPITVRGTRGPVRIACEFGAIEVRDIEGDATLSDKSAPIDAMNVSGRVEARNSAERVTIDGAGSAHVENKMRPVTLRHVAHDATVVAPFCEVTASDVGGDLKIDSGNQTVTVDGVGGRLWIQHKTGKVDARNVKGAATILGNLSNVLLRDVAGAAEVRSPNAPIRLERIGGRTIAENSAFALELVDLGGDVAANASGGILKARFAKLPADGAAHELQLDAAGGAIELELPEDGSLALELSSTIGQLECELPNMTFISSGGARIGTLTLGDGKAKLRATCVGGAIRVRRAAPTNGAKR